MNYAHKMYVTLMLVTAWPLAVLAQGQVIPNFAGNLDFYEWKTYGFILLYSAVGAGTRLATDLRKDSLALGPADLFALALVSATSGFLAFVGMEAFFQWVEYQPPSGAVGGVIILAAFNRKNTIVAMSSAIRDVADNAVRKYVDRIDRQPPRNTGDED